MRRLSWKWFVAIAVAVPVVAVVPVVAARTVPEVPAVAAVAPFSAGDVGFAEGAGPYDNPAARLDGLAGFLPGKSPIVRIDLDWWRAQPCRECPVDWAHLDPLVDAAHARGVRVLLILGYAPPWAGGHDGTDKYLPRDDADWTRVVRETVAHFGGKVQAYEVWNEPNLVQFARYDGDVKARYWHLVELAHRQVKAGCAGCVVVAGGSGAGTPPADPHINPNEPALWLDWAYRNGYGRYFDAVAHHPYPAHSVGKGPADPECTYRWWNMFGPSDQTRICGELAYVRSVMVKHGDADKKIWATEFGYPTAGHSRIPPLATVRDHLVQGVQMWRSLPYTGPLFIYRYQDPCARPDDSECHFGVVTPTGAPKEPLYGDLSRALTDRWPASLSSGQELRRWAALQSLDGQYQLWLQGDGNLVLYRRRTAEVMWATNTSDGVRLVNRADGNLVLYRADGTITWQSGTGGQGASTLWAQEDGNLVLYRRSDAKATWASMHGRLVR